ncbi:two-component system chemotaxis sensor kinase CheA [Alkalihalobacillus xiaoxiensis]|uniref:Chemotaxis protein CheA n=1 Tax=Shouchella xiaoxiensis TaxID=766895 RepID=A0ABS2SSW9_9BACI|nr:chemotaxis protein CheA [Shouchella xiaoxiensis]MBM7838609.1 two-component system chemotaxis sensor kinase CheA [Shouchella xiaoxiensis]
MTQYNYLEMFLEESTDHLKAMNEQLFLLEKASDPIKVLAEIFRSAHTLKGMAASMGFTQIANVTHVLENVLDEMRSGKIDVDSDKIDLFFEAVEQLEQALEQIETSGAEPTTLQELETKLSQLQLKNEKVSIETDSYDESTEHVINQAVEQGIPVLVIAVTVEQTAMLKGVRAYMVVAEVDQFGELLHASPSTEKLEEGEFEETFTLTVATGLSEETVVERLSLISEISSVNVSPYVGKKAIQVETKSNDSTNAEPSSVKKTDVKNQRSIRVQIDKLDDLMYMFEELVIEKGRLEALANQLNHEDLTSTSEKMSRTISHLQDVMLSVRMMPLETVFSRFPRMVRQVSKELGKNISFQLEGTETEIDRAIIDELSDPILHLLRNSMDHGIELPKERVATGKPGEGTITLRAYYSGSKVVIEIEDDGAGIQRERVLDKAISNGLITLEQSSSMNNEDVFQLLFAPGFSTAQAVTDLSGRGVGLDVVKTSLQSLGGEIMVTSEEGKGSLFSIVLPLTVSIMEVMLIGLQKETFAIPVTSILETALYAKKDIQLSNNQEIVQVRGRLVPLYSLNQEMGLDESDADEVPVVILYQNNELAAIKVDTLIGHQEIVLKSLGSILKQTKGLLGATILGSGEIAMIVDASAFFTSKRGGANE